MPTVKALALCPEAIILPARHKRYRQYSRQVMAILHETSSLVEKMSIDEAYLELTESLQTWEEAIEVGHRLQRRVREEVGLSASLGIGTNKLVAKIASDRDKPGGVTIVRPGEEATFLAPLPVRALLGIGPVTARKLAAMGVTTIGDLASMPALDLQARFGRHGKLMARQALGIDSRPVVVEHETKSISQERTFREDLVAPPALRTQLKQLSEGVARRLNDANLSATTIALKLRYSDFTTLSRQTTLSVPTADAKIIYQTANALLERAWKRGRPIRLLGIAASQLSPPARQLPLF
jgi:DNA polymerase-4